jgi:biopolymer transport protein ExbD
MESRGRRPPRATTPNLAPLVDVVMVILIFFMLGTSFVLREGLLPTRLPTDQADGGTDPTFVPVVRIALTPGPTPERCEISVLGHSLPDGSFDALQGFLRNRRVRGADPQGRIIIAASPTVLYQSVISAVDACVRAGFKNVQFAVSAGPVAGTAAPGRS